MILTELGISNFRIVDDALLEPHQALNLVTGNNGSGKSSLLEAIQCLSTGHSFRTRKPRELIAHTALSYRVNAVFNNPVDERIHRAGLERSRDGTTSLRLDFEEISSLVEITRLLPLKALTPDSHKLIQDGPDQRRQFLDWGVFHVEPRFIDHWRDFKRSLVQRNQLLRIGAVSQEISAWDQSYIESAIAIHNYREIYVDRLSAYLQSRVDSMNLGFHVKLLYRSGWTQGEDLQEVMKRNFDYHCKMKTTTDGPHRAELVVSTDEALARQVLSRGQQKVLVYLLHLAQLDVLQDSHQGKAIVLCDDLTSELDLTNSRLLIEQLISLDSQIFVTGIDLERLSDFSHKGFHVKRGVIQNIV